MKKLINSKLLLQVIVAAMVATLATAGFVGAVTTIGANIETAGTLNVDSGTLYVGTTDRVGIGTTTPFATLSVNNTAGENAFVIGSSTATWLKVDASGLLTVAKASTFSGTLASGALTVTGNISATGDLAFANASSTGATKLSVITSDTGAISFDNENLTTTGSLNAATTTIALGDFTVGGTDFYVDDDNARVGIGSSTPFTTLGIGTTAATSTIATGKFCMYIKDQLSRGYWITINLDAADAAAGIFATSTIPCNQ